MIINCFEDRIRGREKVLLRLEDNMVVVVKPLLMGEVGGSCLWSPSQEVQGALSQ